jgi:predicted nuclease of predicted toxin-antitoxin system
VNVVVDAQLPPAIAPWIAERFGVACRAIRETGLQAAGDQEIFQALRREGSGSVILTKDEDFVDLVTRLGPPPRVLWVRFGNVSNSALRAYLEVAWPRAVALLESGEPVVELRSASR